MKKENKVWALITPACHKSLFSLSKQKHIPATKLILDIVFNKLPDQLLEDYSFSTPGRATVIAVGDKEYNHIKELAAAEHVEISRFLRKAIYTYLKHEGYLVE